MQNLMGNTKWDLTFDQEDSQIVLGDYTMSQAARATWEIKFRMRGSMPEPHAK